MSKKESVDASVSSAKVYMRPEDGAGVTVEDDGEDVLVTNRRDYMVALDDDEARAVCEGLLRRMLAKTDPYEDDREASLCWAIGKVLDLLKEDR